MESARLGSTAQTNKTEVIHPLGEGDFSFAAPFPRLAPAQRLDAFSPMSGRRKTEADGASECPTQRGNGVAYCVDFRR